MVVDGIVLGLTRLKHGIDLENNRRFNVYKGGIVANIRTPRHGRRELYLEPTAEYGALHW